MMPWSGKNPMTVAGCIIWGVVQLEQVRLCCFVLLLLHACVHVACICACACHACYLMRRLTPPPPPKSNHRSRPARRRRRSAPPMPPWPRCRAPQAWRRSRFPRASATCCPSGTRCVLVYLLACVVLCALCCVAFVLLRCAAV
jgi:hypothetical protein